MAIMQTLKKFQIGSLWHIAVLYTERSKSSACMNSFFFWRDIFMHNFIFSFKNPAYINKIIKNAKKAISNEKKQEKCAMPHQLWIVFLIINIFTTYCRLECGTLKARQTIWNQQFSVHIFFALSCWAWMARHGIFINEIFKFIHI